METEHGPELAQRASVIRFDLLLIRNRFYIIPGPRSPHYIVLFVVSTLYITTSIAVEK